MDVRLTPIGNSRYFFTIDGKEIEFNDGNHLVIMPTDEDIDEEDFDDDDSRFALYLYRPKNERYHQYVYIPSQERYQDEWIEFIYNVINGKEVHL